MATPSATTVTVRDVLNGLESMEQWVRQLREALATIDQRPLDVASKPVPGKSPKISGGLCGPPDNPKTTPKKPKKPTKK